MFLFRNGVITMNINETNGELPFGEQPPIDVNEYLKSIEESDIISIDDNIKKYLKQNKKHTTLTEVQKHNGWGNPSGVKPNRAYSFSDLIEKLKKKPNEPFSLSDVWVNTNKVYVARKFNRIPNLKAAIRYLNFSEGLDWVALDTPHYILVKIDGEIVLLCIIGGHRTTMCVLSLGFNSEIPVRVTYLGSLDIKTVHDVCARVHHIDCNKRVNQNAQDRIASGVEAHDPEFIEIARHLLECKLYVSEDKIKPEKIKDEGLREVTSWMSFNGALKAYKKENVKYASEKLIEYTNSGEKIISQAIETIACMNYHFRKDISKMSPEKDVFDQFLDEYFKNPLLSGQSSLRSHNLVAKDCLALVLNFNLWAKKGPLKKRYDPISKKRIVDEIGDDVTLS